MVVSFFIKKSPFKKNNNKRHSTLQKSILTIYSLLRVLFILGLFCIIIMFIVYSLVKTFLFVKYIPYMEINQTTVVIIAKQLLTMTIVFIITQKYTVSIYKFIKKKL